MAVIGHLAIRGAHYINFNLWKVQSGLLCHSHVLLVIFYLWAFANPGP